MSISTVISSAIAKPRNNWDLRHNEATTQDIVALILWADDRVKADTKNFAKDLEGYCLEETANNIHHALTRNVKFVEDPDGVQMLKSPAQLWNDKKGDCKSFALFTASVLQNLGIDYTYRFVSETTAPVHHVYVVVTESNGTEYIIDPTVKEFNRELPYNHRIDHVMQYSASMNGKKYANRTQEFAICGSEGNARIGDITDKLLFKLTPNKRDQVRDKIQKSVRKTSPIFLYLFYYKTWEAQNGKPLPRAAIYKLKFAIEIFRKMSQAFQMEMSQAEPGFLFFIEIIEAFFQNKSVFEKTEEAWSAGVMKWNVVIPASAWILGGFDNIQKVLQPYKQGDKWSIPANEETICKLYSQFMNYTVPDLNKRIGSTLELLPLISTEFSYYQTDNNAPAHLHTPEGVIKNSFKKSTEDNCWCVGYYTARSDKGNLVIFTHTDGFQRERYLDAFPAGRYVYLDMRFYAGDASASRIPRVAKIIKTLHQGNLIGLELDAPALAGSSQNILCGIFKLPSIITNKESADDYVAKTNYTRVEPKKAGRIKLLHNGSYEIENTLASTSTATAGPFGTLTLPGGSVIKIIFDPDGLPISGTNNALPQYKKFAITSSTAYISGARIGCPPCAVIVPLIVALLGAISSIVGSILAMKAGEGEFMADNGPPDFRYNPESCKWHNEAEGILTCQKLDGSGWVFVNQRTGMEIAPDPNPEGSGESGFFFNGILNFFKTPAGLGLAGLGLFAIVNDDKSKRKRR